LVVRLSGLRELAGRARAEADLLKDRVRKLEDEEVPLIQKDNRELRTRLDSVSQEASHQTAVARRVPMLEQTLKNVEDNWRKIESENAALREARENDRAMIEELR